VRRTTGGGAILHDRELTYALVLPWSHSLLKNGPNTLYNHVHHAVAGLLAGHGLTVTPGPAASGGCSHRGSFFCFERHSCYDLLVEGRKLMGSAQRRTRWAILQHGSLILERTHSQQASAAVADVTALDIDAHCLPFHARDRRGCPERARRLHAERGSPGY
jgi:lipoate-protein ligase A